MKDKSAIWGMCLAMILTAVSYLSAGADITPHERNDSSTYIQRLEKLSNASLLRIGTDGIEHDSIKQAVASLSVLANRYYDEKSDTTQRKFSSEAMRLLANIYMSYDIDYRKAYRYLKLAKQIAEEDDNDYDLAFIYLSLVNLYCMNNTDEDFSHIHNLIKDGIDLSVRSSNEIALSCFLIDIMIMIENGADVKSCRDMIAEADKYEFHSGSRYAELSKHVLAGLDAYFAKDLHTSELEFIKACDGVEELRFGERIYIPLQSFLMKLYRMTDDIEKAKTTGKRILALAESKGYRDNEMHICKTLYELYTATGESTTAENYHNKYLQLEEIMKDESGYGSIQTMDFISEIERINTEVENLSITRQRNQKINIIIISTLCILLLILAGMLYVYLNLKKNHRQLYERNQQMTKQASIHRMMRQQWEEEKRELTERLSRQPSSESTEKDSSENETSADSDDNAAHRLFKRIVEVIETSDEIYKQKFSMNDLASMLGVTPRAVSRAINLCYNENFHKFLIGYRIREVSRLMHDPENRNMTIESLAESVGFSSRTYFATVFKKELGLTPSEYIKMRDN